MIKHFTILSLILGLSFAHAKEALLFSPEKPQPLIVLSAEAEDQERYAAEDLRHYLEEMTGRQWSVGGSAPEGVMAIHIGKVPGNEPLLAEVENGKLGRDGFVLEVSEGAVRVAGGSKFGTSYGVYELLERMGVRWFFPGEWGEVIPKVKELRLPEGKVAEKPAFAMRQMHTARGDEAVGDWFRRSRHNRSGFYGHSRLIRPERYGATHPEWFAEVDGGRRVDDPNYKLCHSNDAMVERAAEEVLQAIRERKGDTKVIRHDGYPHLASDYNLLSISPRDGGAFCRCEKCVAMGPLSDRLQIFANRIVERVRQEFPDYQVGYYGAYAEHQAPPKVKAGPGVVVFPTTWTRNFFKPLTDISNRVYLNKIRAFREMCPQMALRDFDGLSVWWGPGPLTLADVHAADYRLYREMGLRGIITEAGSGWGPWGYSYYLMGKLWWNPDADLEALKRDFVEKAYGEAAEPMRTYYTLLDKAAVHPSPKDLSTMRLKLEEAARLAKDEGVKKRVNYLRAHYLLTDLYEKFRAGESSQEDVELFHQVNASIDPSVSPFTRVGRYQREFPKSRSPREPLKEAELEKVLAGVKIEVVEREFARWLDQDDLKLQPITPNASEEIGEDLGMSFRFGPTTILIYAKAGERIDLRQVSTKWETYATAYELQNPELVTIAEGVAEGETILDIPAPSEGVYTLALSFGSRYPNLRSSNRSIVLKASGKQKMIQPMGKVAQAYFHVPEGTKEFAIVTKAYEPLSLRVEGAVGQSAPMSEIRQTAQTFVEHVIPVPEGADNKVWRVSFAGGKKDIFLQGIPPFIASHPARLLVPDAAGRRVK